MQSVAKILRCASVGAVCVTAMAAQAQSWTPLAFGPLGGLPSGQYFTSVADISRDGRTFVGVTNTAQQIWRTPTQDYAISGGTVFSITPSGLSAVGGTSGQNPKRWDISGAIGSSVAAVNINWPGGPIAYGAAYSSNADMTAFAVVAPNTGLITTTGGYTSAQSVFQAVTLGASAGAFRGMAADAPIMAVLGSIPGNTANAYRWNYQTNTLSPLAVPAGASHMSLSTLAGSITGDGARVVGTATFGVASLPYWWDQSGTPHPVEMIGGAVTGSLLTINHVGTLAGGHLSYSGGLGNRAIITDLATGDVINLHNAYSQAGLLPTGWILRTTHHISEDGSRIFCLAQAPDGTTRVVALDGSHVPTPGALAVLAGGVLVTARRRR